VVRNKTPLLPLNEGRVGVFSGLQTGDSKRIARQSSKVNPSDMPAGMSSVAAANKAAASQPTSMGALVQMPDGQTMVVPTQNVPPQMPSVPINAANAFTMTMPTAPVMAEAIQKGPNAFSMTSPVRPVPADFGQPNMVPNAFYAGATPNQDPRMAGGMPGMAAAMQGYQYPVNQPMPVAGYMANPGAYAPPAMAGYGIATVGYNGGGVPAGVAMASDMSNGLVGGCLLTLRQSILPSEREKAAETLCQVNWKSDPQIVPALVMAAKSDPAPMVRVSCVRALGHMKANSAPTVEAIKTLKTDSDPRVRQAVEQVLPVLLKP
ncbi:MAG: HEAT repeat domain-containing protein, partial [Gemmataceae bacterium]